MARSSPEWPRTARRARPEAHHRTGTGLDRTASQSPFPLPSLFLAFGAAVTHNVQENRAWQGRRRYLLSRVVRGRSARGAGHGHTPFRPTPHAEDRARSTGRASRSTPSPPCPSTRTRAPRSSAWRTCSARPAAPAAAAGQGRGRIRRGRGRGRTVGAPPAAASRAPPRAAAGGGDGYRYESMAAKEEILRRQWAARAGPGRQGPLGPVGGRRCRAGCEATAAPSVTTADAEAAEAERRKAPSARPSPRPGQRSCSPCPRRSSCCWRGGMPVPASTPPR